MRASEISEILDRPVSRFLPGTFVQSRTWSIIGPSLPTGDNASALPARSGRLPGSVQALRGGLHPVGGDFSLLALLSGMLTLSHHTCESPQIVSDTAPLPVVAFFIRARRGPADHSLEPALTLKI